MTGGDVGVGVGGGGGERKGEREPRKETQQTNNSNWFRGKED